jgi:hypothetical protein
LIDSAVLQVEARNSAPGSFVELPHGVDLMLGENITEFFW